MRLLRLVESPVEVAGLYFVNPACPFLLLVTKSILMERI